MASMTRRTLPVSCYKGLGLGAPDFHSNVVEPAEFVMQE